MNKQLNKHIKYLVNTFKNNQKTDEWYKLRNKIITSTDVATILNKNKYQNKFELLQIKNNQLNSSNNDNKTEIIWGNAFEDIARNIYSNLNNNLKIFETGLINHNKYNWLGASPDGICENGELVEIKCVFGSRNIIEIPEIYYIQTQIQLEVCNLDICNLFQCKFIEISKEYYNNNKNDFMFGYNKDLNIYYKLANYTINIINRDKNWFSNVQPILYNFFCDMNNFNKNNKRKYDNDNNNIIETRSSKRIKKYIKENNNKLINIYKFKNYFTNNCLIDWLNLYGERNGYYKKNIFSEYNFNKNNNYLINNFDLLIDNFYNKNNNTNNNNDNIIINFNNDILDNYKDIFNNYNNNVIKNFKVCDDKYTGYIKYLVPGNILNYIFFNENNNTNNNNKNKQKKNIIYFDDNKYYNCDLINKYNTKYIREFAILNNRILLNNLKQNNLIDNINENEIILIRNYENEKDINKIKYEIININFENNEKVDNCIKWYKDLEKEGNNWKLEDIQHLELRPNLSYNLNSPWYQVLKNIAFQLKDPICLYKINLNQRKKLYENSIYTYNDSKLLTQNIIKLHPITLKQIELINSNKKIIPEEKDWDIEIWEEDEDYEIFVDLETFSGKMMTNYGLETENDKSFVYMLGCGYLNNKKERYTFKNYNTTEFTYENEKDIFIKWINTLNKKIDKYDLKYIKLYHWGNIEENIINSKLDKYDLSLTNNAYINYIDLLEVFRNIPIVIKDVFNYGLKDVVKKMDEYGYINCKWDEEINGNITLSLINNKEMLEQVIRYNEKDVLALYEILKFLRRKYL